MPLKIRQLNMFFKETLYINLQCYQLKYEEKFDKIAK